MTDALAEEIARLRARAAPPDPLAEIAALRARLARIEAAATATTPAEGDKPMDLEQVVGGHYSRIEPPTREQKQLASIARGFVPDPQSEAALAARAKDPAAYDAAQRAMHADELALSLYSRGRDAAIKLGTFVPEKGTDPK
jgi:hypothetical protein